jgi:HK97 family phage portal protein
MNAAVSSWLPAVQAYLPSWFRSLRSKTYSGMVDTNFFVRGLTLGEALHGARTGDIRQSYCTEVYVYSAINACALNVSQVPFRFYTGTDLDRDDVLDSVWEPLFERPNPFLSRFQLWEATMIYLKLRGECFWVLESPLLARGRTTGDVPGELWPMDPLRFQPVIDQRTKALTGWMMASEDGKDRVFLEHGVDVIQFKKYNPYNTWRGLSPLEAAAKSISMGVNARTWNDAMLQNGAEPGGVLSTDQPMTKDQMTQIRDAYEARHSGPANVKRTAILHSGLKYQQIAMSAKDAAFIETANLTVEDILAVLRVPKTEVFKYDDVRKETAEVQDRALWTKNLVPECMYIEDELWSSLFSTRGPKTEWGLFDLSSVPALQDSITDKLAAAQQMFGMGFPMNEISKRLDLGVDPTDWGYTGYLPMGLVPVHTDGVPIEPELPNESGPEGTRRKPVPLPPKTPAAKPKKEFTYVSCGQPGRRWLAKRYAPQPVEAPTKASPEAVEGLQTLPALITRAAGQAARTRRAQAFYRALLPLEQRFESKMTRLFYDLRVRVLHLLPFGYASAFADIKPKLRGAARALYDVTTQEAARCVTALLAKDGRQSIYLQQIVLRRTGKITNIADTVERHLREQLAQAAAEGASQDALAQIVKDTFNVATARARTIARTEVFGAGNEAAFVAMGEDGVRRVEWVTRHDDLVRDSHEACDGEVRTLGEVFSNGLLYPGEFNAPPEEVINCRCVLLPVRETA